LAALPAGPSARRAQAVGCRVGLIGHPEMPYHPNLADRMRAALQARADVVEEKMFGGYCWMLRGNMLCGVEAGRFVSAR